MNKLYASDKTSKTHYLADLGNVLGGPGDPNGGLREQWELLLAGTTGPVTANKLQAAMPYLSIGQGEWMSAEEWADNGATDPTTPQPAGLGRAG